ncbi:MAG: hypothetical protein HW400_701 [Candidatus Levybacteria bacterium]|nr:hypothetical protein [Candidatus Levybacteria bacterium]
MTLKTIQVISPGSIETREGEGISVHFSYGLDDKKDFEILTKNNDRYIFTAFVIKAGQPLYVFGDARRHEELEKAIIADIGALDKCIHGQLWFRGSETAIALTFKSALGRSNGESEKNLLAFLNSINQELLGDRVRINDLENIYDYRKSDKTLRNFNRN